MFKVENKIKFPYALGDIAKFWRPKKPYFRVDMD
jgi:hypothetical protein